MSHVSMVRPIIVLLDKADITGALADGVFSSVISLDMGHMREGSTRDYCIKQMAIASEDAVTSWSVAFWNDSSGGDATDLDSDAIAAIEVATQNHPVISSPTTLEYYTNSDMEVYVRAEPTGADDQPAGFANTRRLMQMYVQIAPNGAAKTAGTGGEIIARFWAFPIIGV